MEHDDRISFQKFSEYDDHERVVSLEDSETGLRGFIAIHKSIRGRAVGGTRMFPYLNNEDAVRDALRLSRAMTYKCALAGIPCGGDKGVIIADPDLGKTDQLLVAYAAKIDALRGSFFTGEDVGIEERDVQLMLRHSPYFIGKAGGAGDPSPYAALSTLYATETAADAVFGSERLAERTVAVKGVGKVGSELVRLLAEAGAEILVADKKTGALEALRKKLPEAHITVVDPEHIREQRVDVYAPCALGNEFTVDAVSHIRAPVICGAANNQLASPEAGDALFGAGILYVPDYVANAGGLVNVIDELEPGGYRRERVLARILRIKDMLRAIFSSSREQRKSPSSIADELAVSIIRSYA